MGSSRALEVSWFLNGALVFTLDAWCTPLVLGWEGR